MDRGTYWRLLPPGLRRLPADLAAVVAVVVLVNLAVFTPVLAETPLRVVVGLPFGLFVPGYALVAALFPEAGEASEGRAQSPGTDPSGGFAGEGIDGLERAALSFGLSIAVVPLLGLVLNFTPWGIRLVPIMVATSGFTLVATWVGARRRRALPREERFRVPYRRWLSAARGELFEPDSRTDAALNVLLAVSVLLATVSVGYAVAVPKQGESFTEFYLLTETESGDLVADEYPTEFTLGEGRDLVVGIGNQEHERVRYVAVVELQRVAAEGNETTILESRRLRQFDVTLAHNETWQRAHEVRPTMPGERLRLQYLLYRGEPPSTVGPETAYRETHLWVNVTEE